MSSPVDSTRETLRMLAIFHHVLAGAGLLLALFPLLHLVLGLFLLSMPAPEPPRITGSLHSPEAAELAVEREAGPAAEADPGMPPAWEPPERAKGWDTDARPERFIGLVFVSISALFILGGLAFSLLMFLAGRRLRAARSHGFCVVAAAIECLLVPLGTLLGVFTLVTLMKPEARELFGLPPASDA